jgi:hypothetical protein
MNHVERWNFRWTRLRELERTEIRSLQNATRALRIARLRCGYDHYLEQNSPSEIEPYRE